MNEVAITETKAIGRPTDYSPELVVEICKQLAEGMSIRTVCLADNMPGTSTVFEWLAKYPEFAEQYARAKQASADAMAEDILDIADDGTNDWMEKNGYDVPNGEALQRSKLRVDTRKWLMSKMKPKKYADAIDITSGGEPVTVKVLNYYAGNNTTPSLPA